MSDAPRFRIRPQVLDRIREIHGLGSDEEVARHLRLTLGTVSNIRRGKEPSMWTFLKLADAAHVTRIEAALERVAGGEAPDGRVA